MKKTPKKNPKRSDAVRTRSRLLSAAGKLFAKNGYSGTNLREICRAAEVNLGAVTYYFGSKRDLYLEALVAPHRELVQAEPLPTLDDAETPEEALRAWIGYFLRLILVRRPAHPYLGRLVAKELVHPTVALDELVELVFKVVRGELVRIVAALTDKSPDSREVGEMVNITMGICGAQEMARSILERVGYPPPRTAGAVDALADKIHRFALAGILALK